MKRLLPLTSVTTISMAFAALRAGAGVANATAFLKQTLFRTCPASQRQKSQLTATPVL
jgi:hypothetical protein